MGTVTEESGTCTTTKFFWGDRFYYNCVCSEENEGAVGYTEPTPEVVAPAKPNMQEDFPMLSGAAAPPPAASGLIHFNSRGGRLNMSEEHFPSLSSGDQGSNVNISLQRGPAQRTSNNFSIKVKPIEFDCKRRLMMCV
jgi:hypothetical protein